VFGETPLPLQVEDKCPDFILADLGYIGAHPLKGEEICKVAYAVGNDGNGIGALPLSGGAELVTMK